MTNLREQLELIEVTYQNENKKVVLTFLDEEMGEVLEVNFNKQRYDNGEYVDDTEKAAQVGKWCEEYFETEFNKLSDCVGVKKDVYKYDTFNSLWESKQIQKFKVEDKGKIFSTTIKNITDDGRGIHITFDYKDEEHESKMMYADYIESRKEWFVNPQKKNQKYKKFKELFGVDLDQKEEIIGKEIMVEIKVAFNKFAYAEIKKPEWA